MSHLLVDQNISIFKQINRLNQNILYRSPGILALLTFCNRINLHNEEGRVHSHPTTRFKVIESAKLLVCIKYENRAAQKPTVKYIQFSK